MAGDYAELPAFVDAMVDAMYSSEGVGLAAPQLGRNIRVVLVDVSAGEDKNALRVMVNPVLLQQSIEMDVRPEGCLSVPGGIYNVKRPLAAKVRYLDRSLNIVEVALYDMEARIFYHEFDHLNGVLISDVGTRATLKTS